MKSLLFLNGKQIMKNAYYIISILCLGTLNIAKSQDTIVLKNQSRVVCRVTQIYSARIEYLKPDDTARKQYYSYLKSDVKEILYANGERVQIANKAVSASTNDTTKTAEENYRQGFQDGYQYYRPVTERIVGASVILVPFVSLPGCIYYSFTKVKEREVLSYRYQKNTNADYRNGYLAGASRRRRVAAWSNFGGVVGTAAVLGIMLSSAYSQ
ncbi:MAG: hypothetical protein RLZZ161_324 [Bacteroidota bacterium]